jgi:hypothetical protein
MEEVGERKRGLKVEKGAGVTLISKIHQERRRLHGG